MLIRSAGLLSGGNVLLRLCGQHARTMSATVALNGKYIKTEVQDGIGIVTFDHPDLSVNTLHKAIDAELEEAYQTIWNNPSVRGVVLTSAKPGCFIAGADINMISACQSAAEIQKLSTDGQKLLAQIENSKKPTVAAIMGSCLGGGLEVALACHYRIAVNNDKTKLGLPEVQLGLLPGAGGTQRLPRLISVPAALDMALTGKNIVPSKAKKMGLVDATIEPLGPGTKPADVRTLEYLREVAIQTAKGLADGAIKRQPPKKSLVDKVTDLMLKYDKGRDYVFGKAKTQVMKATKGKYPAPLKIIEVIRTGVEKGPVEGYAAESKGFGELGMTNESKALIGLFHGSTEAKKNKFGTPKHQYQLRDDRNLYFFINSEPNPGVRIV